MTPRFLNMWAIGLVLAAGELLAAEPIELRYKGEADQSTPYRNTTKIEQQIEVNGQEFKTTMELTDLTLRTIERVTEAGDRRIKTANKRLTVNADMGPAGKYKFDSEDSEHERGTALAAALNPAFETLAGAEVRFTLTPLGEIKDVAGYEEILKNVVQDNPTAGAFIGGGSDKAFAINMADLLIQLPMDAVRPGDTWEKPYELELPSVGKVIGKRKFKFEEVTEQDGRQLAKISVTHEMDIDANIDSGDAKVTGKFSISNSSGTVMFDVEAGQVASTELSLTTSGEFTTTVGDQTLNSSLEQTHQVSSTRLAQLPQ